MQATSRQELAEEVKYLSAKYESLKKTLDVISEERKHALQEKSQLQMELGLCKKELEELKKQQVLVFFIVM